MLGQNALSCLGLDAAPFEDAAKRIGPSVVDITNPTDDVDPDMLSSFHKRSGYASPAEQVDCAAIDSWLTDLVAVS